MKNRIILVHPKLEGTHDIVYPLSCLALAATLERENFSPVIINMEVEENYSDLAARHLDDALFVGISAFTGLQIKYGLEFCDFVRKCNPNLPIVWGGWHPTSLPEQTTQDSRVDIVVRGEGDFVVVELAKALQERIPLSEVKGITYKVGERVLSNVDADPIRDLNVLPPTPWHLIDIEAYIRRYRERTLCVQTGRGCAMRCRFCSHKVMPNQIPRSFSARYVFDNIEHIIRDFHITHLRFYEPTLIASRKRAVEICEEIRRRNLTITWVGGSRANVFARFDDDICTMLRQSGCVRMNFGFESGSQWVLDRIAKKTKRDDVLRTVKKCKDHDIAVEGNFILGFPFETTGDILDTIELILEIQKIAPGSKICLGLYQAYPETELYNECREKYGLPMVPTLQDWGQLPEWIDVRPWLNSRRRLFLRLARMEPNLKSYLQALDRCNVRFKWARVPLYVLALFARNILLSVKRVSKKRGSGAEEDGGR